MPNAGWNVLAEQPVLLRVIPQARAVHERVGVVEAVGPDLEPTRRQVHAARTRAKLAKELVFVRNAA
jgi:hypothetical protein